MADFGKEGQPDGYVGPVWTAPRELETKGRQTVAVCFAFGLVVVVFGFDLTFARPRLAVRSLIPRSFALLITASFREGS